jgi:membrane protein YqaA with SNARE-associated domain
MDFGTLIAGFGQWSQYVIATFGYPGVFFVSLVSSASIFFPIPGFLFILAASPVLNPFLLGIVAGAGSAIGELTGYILGRGGKKTIEKKEIKWIKKGEDWFRRGRGFWFIFIFAATPLPDDVAGIVAGLFSYSWKKFLLASFIGKTILNIAIALGGFYGIGAILTL